MKQSIAHDTPAQVEQTLAAYGSWDAISFLLTCNLLKHEDYEAWRIGEHRYLEDVLIVGQQHLLCLLQTAL
ncbi:MAG: hypothetical protein R8L58_00335, partial [Mariprofundaceae bacterium]